MNGSLFKRYLASTLILMGLACSSVNAANFKVVHAWYGFDGNETIDVTTKLAEQLNKDGYLSFPADMNKYYGKDPIPNKVKVTAYHLQTEAGHNFHFRTPEWADSHLANIVSNVSGKSLNREKDPKDRKLPSGFPDIMPPAEMEAVHAWYGNETNVVIDKIKENIKEFGFIYMPDIKKAFNDTDSSSKKLAIHLRLRNHDDVGQILDVHLRADSDKPFIFYPINPAETTMAKEEKKDEPKKDVEEKVVEKATEDTQALDMDYFALTHSVASKQLLKNTQQKHTINYGDIIELNHVYGNVQIHANNAFKYNNEGGSGQVQVQGWTAPGQEENFFIVKGADGQDDKEGPVKSGDIIRLEHKISKMNLHSHASHQSPNDIGYEITLFGSDGKGDSNDNWVLMVMDDDQIGNPAKSDTEWTTRDSINFYHHNTSDNKAVSTVSGKRFLTWGGPNQMFDVWTTNEKTSPKRHDQFELALTGHESHWFVSAFHKDTPKEKKMAIATTPPKKVTADKEDVKKQEEGDKDKDKEDEEEDTTDVQSVRTRRTRTARTRRTRGTTRQARAPRTERSTRGARTRTTRSTRASRGRERAGRRTTRTSRRSARYEK